MMDYINSLMDIHWPLKKRYYSFSWAEKLLRKFDGEFRAALSEGHGFWDTSVLHSKAYDPGPRDYEIISAFQVYCFMLDGLVVSPEETPLTHIYVGKIKEVHHWWERIADRYNSSCGFSPCLEYRIGWPREDVFCCAARLHGASFQKIAGEYMLTGVPENSLWLRLDESMDKSISRLKKDIRRYGAHGFLSMFPPF